MVRGYLWSFGLGALLSAATASPVTQSPAQRRQDGTFAITGPTGGVMPRQEIRTLQSSNPDLWNLFLAAMEQFKAVDQSEQLSFFRIAAIHGQPTGPWDGVESDGGYPGFGYCPHSSNLFGTWHRPYLALLEQSLQAVAIQIVDALPDGADKTKFQGLAQQLRFPYWDWALDLSPILPVSISSETIDITYPNGTQANIPNPLFQYNFHPLDPSDFSTPFDKWDHTVRNPANISDPTLPSNNTESERVIELDHSWTRTSLYNLFTQYQTFNEFSNAGSESTPIGNLENIHNGIHSDFGPGHMQYLQNSAFDPVFWFHHCNVDRVIAIWQKIYPDTFVTPYTQAVWTYTIAKGSVQDATSPLKPFHKDTAGTFFSSNDVSDHTIFGYTYPELQNNPSNDTLKASVNALYAPAAASSSSKSKRATTQAYMAAIQAPLTALDGSYSINVFVGDPSPDPLNWLLDGGYAGTMHVLSQPGMPSAGSISGTVYLTEKVNTGLLAGLLDDLGIADVLTKLQKNFQVKVLKDGVEIPKEQLPGLKVSVFSTEVEPRTSDSDFPRWLGLTEHKDITGGWAAWGSSDN